MLLARWGLARNTYMLIDQPQSLNKLTAACTKKITAMKFFRKAISSNKYLASSIVNIARLISLTLRIVASSPVASIDIQADITWVWCRRPSSEHKDTVLDDCQCFIVEKKGSLHNHLVLKHLDHLINLLKSVAFRSMRHVNWSPSAVSLESEQLFLWETKQEPNGRSRSLSLPDVKIVDFG